MQAWWRGTGLRGWGPRAPLGVGAGVPGAVEAAGDTGEQGQGQGQSPWGLGAGPTADPATQPRHHMLRVSLGTAALGTAWLTTVVMVAVAVAECLCIPVPNLQPNLQPSLQRQPIVVSA